MEQITVRKSDLVKIVTENRERHRATFQAAQVRYRERVIEELDQRLADARDGRQINLMLSLPVPEDHTADYDRVLRMLRLSVDEQIVLSEADVAMYVQDDWAWKRAWMGSTASYLMEG